jgi:hypothetical protein
MTLPTSPARSGRKLRETALLAAAALLPTFVYPIQISPMWLMEPQSDRLHFRDIVFRKSAPDLVLFLPWSIIQGETRSGITGRELQIAWAGRRERMSEIFRSSPGALFEIQSISPGWASLTRQAPYIMSVEAGGRSLFAPAEARQAALRDLSLWLMASLFALALGIWGPLGRRPRPESAS